jgi:tRNA(Ile)-lysidine synthase TilS/MesJ
VLPENYPNISFDDEGVCSVCRDYKEHKILGEDKLRQIISKYKGTGGKYDCLVGTGGGRDSTYILYTIKKKLGLNPLALNYDNGFRHPQGIANFENACRILNVDHITAGSKVDKQLLATHLEHAIWPGFCEAENVLAVYGRGQMADP